MLVIDSFGIARPLHLKGPVETHAAKLRCSSKLIFLVAFAWVGGDAASALIAYGKYVTSGGKEIHQLVRSYCARSVICNACNIVIKERVFGSRSSVTPAWFVAYCSATCFGYQPGVTNKVANGYEARKKRSQPYHWTQPKKKRPKK